MYVDGDPRRKRPSSATSARTRKRLRGFDWAIAETRAGLGPRRSAQHRLAPDGPDLPARPRGEARAPLGRRGRARADVHLRRPARPLERRRGRSSRASASSRASGSASSSTACPSSTSASSASSRSAAVVQPLFSAFGEESLLTRLDDAGTAAILTQRKHLPKVRRIRAQLPALRTSSSSTRTGSRLQDGEVALDLDAEPRRRGLPRLPRHGRDALGPPLHLGHDRAAQGRAARPRLARLAVPDGEVGARPEDRTTSTGATPTPAG